MRKEIYIFGLAVLGSVAVLGCGAKPSTEGAGAKSGANPSDINTQTSGTPVQNANLDTQKSGSAPVSTELVWYGFEEGMEKAKREKKVLLVDAYTDWCGWCKVMDRETYKNAEVIAKLNKDFVAVKFNPEIDKQYNVDGATKNGEGLLMWLSQGNPGGYPTSYFVFNPSKNYNRAAQPGYLAPADFMSLLDLVLSKRGS